MGMKRVRACYTCISYDGSSASSFEESMSGDENCDDADADDDDDDDRGML